MVLTSPLILLLVAANSRLC